MTEFDIDDILLEASYKNKKGYIDIQSSDDIKFLENIMYEMKYPSELITEFIENLSEARPEKHKEVSFEFNESGVKQLNKLGIKYNPEISFAVQDKIVGTALRLNSSSLSRIPDKDLNLFTNDKYTYWVANDDSMTLIANADRNKAITIVRQVGERIRPDDYEKLICMAYNMAILNMPLEEAITKSGMVGENFDRAIRLYQLHGDIITKIGEKILNFGKSPLIHVGRRGNEIRKSDMWPGKDSTPKTDISNATDNRISVKLKFSSRLMSGTKDEAKGTFEAAKALYKTQTPKRETLLRVAKIIKKIENEFKRYTDMDEGVKDLKTLLYTEYKDYRKLQLKKSGEYNKYKQHDIDRHISAEASDFDMHPKKMKTKESDFVKGIKKPSDVDTFLKYFRKNSAKDSMLKERMIKIFDLNVIHAEIKDEVTKAFEDVDFTKWVVYEASSGVYKFSGGPNLVEDTNLIAIANKIMLLNPDTGETEVYNITEEWAKSKSEQVTMLLAFKSSGTYSYSTFQILANENINENTNFIESIIEDEINLFSLKLDSLNIIDESIFKTDIKSHLQNVYGKIKNFIAELYENILEKIFKKIRDFAKVGLEFLLQMLGIEIDGEAYVDLQF